MPNEDRDEKPTSLWLNVFHNSRVNGAEYREDRLPSHPWSWPTDTYLQRRLRAVRAQAADEPVSAAQNSTTRQAAPRADCAARQRKHRSPMTCPIDNANRAMAMASEAQENRPVIEWEKFDERLARLAYPNNN